MMKIRYFIIIVLIVFYSCSNENINKKTTVEKCLCDSIGVFNENGKKEIDCYFGKSLIGITSESNNDTVEVTRYYTTDTVWHIQEYLIIVNDEIVKPSFAVYCAIKDTSDFYKLTHISDEFRFKEIIANKILGVEIILKGDTIRTNNTFALVPKHKFNGIVKIDKKVDVTYKGKKDVSRASIQIDAENMIKYGNLLEQYKVINKLCNKP